MAELLTVENLRAGYGEAVVLQDVSLALGEGQTLALLGRNGTGKTTLINTLAGAARQHGGSIALGAGAFVAASWTALAVGILFWPYPSRCGVGLAGYLIAVAAVTVGGLWSSVWTWRHRTARAHVLSLLLVMWGLVLGAIEVLPHSGYSRADAKRPTGWSCVATAPVTPTPTAPVPH